MFDTIKQVVTDSIEAQGLTCLVRPYTQQVDAIVADICTHISKAGEDVIAQAEAQDFDADEVRRVLVDAGLAVERVEVAEPETEGEPSVFAFQRITDVEGKVDALSSKLDALIRLAERQFGSLGI